MQCDKIRSNSELDHHYSRLNPVQNTRGFKRVTPALSPTVVVSSSTSRRCVPTTVPFSLPGRASKLLATLLRVESDTRIIPKQHGPVRQSRQAVRQGRQAGRLYVLHQLKASTIQPGLYTTTTTTTTTTLRRTYTPWSG